MLRWLSNPPALAGLLIYVAGWQFLRALTRRVVLFPQRRAERQLGHALLPVLEALVTGKRLPTPDGIDVSKYAA